MWRMLAYWHVSGVNLRSEARPEVEAFVTLPTRAATRPRPPAGTSAKMVLMSEANTANPGTISVGTGPDDGTDPDRGTEPDRDTEPDDGTEPDPEADAVVNDPAANRSARRPRDMLLSLIVLMIPVLLIVLAYRTLYGGDTVVTVDPTEVIASAERAGMKPLPPTTGPEGWQTVVAQYRDGTLRLGLRGPAGEGVQLIQSNLPAAELVKAELDGAATAQGERVIDGRTWQRYAAGDDEALVLDLQTTRVLVIGAAMQQPTVADWYTP
jgi:hypothetical protein